MKIEWYQTIPELGIKGRMNTPEEFDKIGLPKDMSDYHSVLDIGCNSGAFLVECNKRGSEFLYGVEPDLVWRLLARGVVQGLSMEDAEIYGKIEDYGSAMTFQIVLLLSVLHLVDDPQKLLDKAWEKTNKLLIVEINDRLQKTPIKLPREAKLYGKNKDNRSVYHIFKNNFGG